MGVSKGERRPEPSGQTDVVIELPTPRETELLGQAIAQQLESGHVVFLEGELGAGKTTLVRSILASLGWTGPVRSPSYALVHTYPSLRPPVNHLDLYRIGSADEALGLDLDHMRQDGQVLLIEWADRLEGALAPSFTVGLEITGPECRRARIAGGQDAYIGRRIIAQGENPT